MIKSADHRHLDVLCDELTIAGVGSVATITWLNHYSALVSRASRDLNLDEFSFIGIDGLLLCSLIGAPARSSADLLVPRLLEAAGSGRVLLVGSHALKLGAVTQRLSERFAGLSFRSIDGYSGLVRGPDLRTFLGEWNPDIVIVGLGPGLQEGFALEAASYMKSGIVLTCGGLLDQLAVDSYYPSWAYPLRLNWLVRVVREPSRLWKRYTIYGLLAWKLRKELRLNISALPGYERVCHSMEFSVSQFGRREGPRV